MGEYEAVGGRSLKDDYRYLLIVGLILISLAATILLIGDESLFYLVNQVLANPVLDAIGPPIASYGALILFMIGTILLAARKDAGSRMAVLLMAASFWLVILFGSSLKIYFGRPRPSLTLNYTRRLAPQFGETSFPSADTMLAFFVWTFIAVKCKRFRVPLLIFAGMVGFLRVYVGVHYPSDVVAGALLGTAIGALVLLMESLVERLLTVRKKTSTGSESLIDIALYVPGLCLTT
ncbi:MAG: phosphatase PAP2 family protein [Promethearchaeota archaeon]